MFILCNINAYLLIIIPINNINGVNDKRLFSKVHYLYTLHPVSDIPEAGFSGDVIHQDNPVHTPKIRLCDRSKPEEGHYLTFDYI